MESGSATDTWLSALVTQSINTVEIGITGRIATGESKTNITSELPCITCTIYPAPDYPAVTLKPMVQVMQLNLFLTILLSLTCGSIAPDVNDVSANGLMSCLILFVVAATMHQLGTHAIRATLTSESEVVSIANRLERQLAIIGWICLGGIIVCLHFLGLASQIVHHPLLNRSLALQAILLLTPGTFLLLYLIYTGERFAFSTSSPRLSFTDQTKRVLRRFRFTLGISMFPILVLLGLIDLVNLLPIETMYASILSLVLVAIFIAIASPWLAFAVIKSEPLDEANSQWIEPLLRNAGLPKIRIAVWKTHLSSMNALVIGFIAPFRTMLISDKLLAELPREQVAMVLLHEAAHLKRKHLPFRMASIIPIWASAAGIAPWLQNEPWFGPVSGLVCILLTLAILRWVAHQTEYDADIEACRLADKTGPILDNFPVNQKDASRALSRALLAVTSDRASARNSSWMHPGVFNRIRSMRANRKVWLPVPSSTSAMA